MVKKRRNAGNRFAVLRNCPNFATMKTIRFIVLFLALVLLNACGTGHSQRALLQKAEACLAESPDLALLYLDSIYSPESRLGKEDYMDYVLLHTEAAWNSGADVKADTAVFEAARYYEKKGDLTRQAKAELYSGCVLQERGDKEAAKRTFYQAYRLASGTDDNALKALSFYCLNYDAGYVNEALARYRQVSALYDNHCLKQVQILYAKGASYSASMALDSSVIYYQKGNLHGLTRDDTLEIGNIYFDESIAYTAMKKVPLSEENLNKAIRLGSTNTNQHLFHLNLSHIYQDLGEADSAAYYASLLKNDLNCVDDDILRISILDFLSGFEYARGETELAYQYKDALSALSDSVYKAQLRQSFYEVQKKYDFETQQNLYNRQLLKRSRIALGLAVLLLILASVVAVLMYRTAQKNKQMERIKDELLSFKQQNKDLQENLSRQEGGRQLLADCEDRLEKELRLRHKLLCQYEIFRTNKGDKAALEAMRVALYGKKDFKKATLDLFDQLYPGLSGVIRQRYPELDEQDFMSVVLSYFNVSRADEALLLGISVDMVDKNRARIRKMMAGFTPEQAQSSE